MASSLAAHTPTAAENGLSSESEDPFSSDANPEQRRSSHRFSAFDTQLFNQNLPSSSPSSAKRALEAHLTETEKRLQETSRLGTALVQQRKDLTERLEEVEQHQGEQEMGPELKQKLVEIEKEYNDLGRESARTFLAPKSRVVSSEDGTGSVTLDARHPASPTKFSSQATDSPSKLNVPSRKQRNQGSSRVHDIEFATEISTSLLAQVRQLQAVLAEREENLKAVNLEKSRLELDAQGFSQRLRSLDESEQRYKDENWGLETQTHELIAAAKESASKEQRLQQALAVTVSEKTAAQRELDEIKQAHGKLGEDHAAFKKNHDTELASLRKNLTVGETDRGSLQRKVDELTSQNQELAKAVASRYRNEENMAIGDLGSEPEDLSLDRSDTDHSPPPSPSKGATRNSMLESETLKSSLHHAHRMIQNLKTNIHREKTEKLELKRMLQESRDELEIRRSETGSRDAGKRVKTKSQVDLSKRKSSQLGKGRNSRTDIEMEDPSWEEQDEEPIPASAGLETRPVPAKRSDTGDAYQTNDDTDAFQTANERDTSTENDAFQTGNERLAGDSSDELTETEGVGRAATVRGSNIAPLPLSKPRNRDSFVSTASTSEDEHAKETRTPQQSQAQRFKLKFNNRGARRSRIDSDGLSNSNPASLDNSPASFMSGNAPKGASLFTELGGLSGDASEEEADGTPSRTSVMIKGDTPVSRPLTAKQTPVYSDAPPPLPATPQTRDMGSQQTPGSAPRPAWEQPLAVIGSIPSFDSQSNRMPSQSPSTFSEIQTLETSPVAPTTNGFAKPRPVTAIQESPSVAPSTPTSESKEAAKGGMLGSVFGWAMNKKQADTQVAEDNTAESMPQQTVPETRTPFKEVPANIMSHEPLDKEILLTKKTVDMADQSSQTILSADQIDSLITARNIASALPATLDQSRAGPGFKASAGSFTDGLRSPLFPDGARSTSRPLSTAQALGRTMKRPGSAGSMRASQIATMPPLPSDHRQAIAAATQQAPAERKLDGVMGPPTVPASAYRRPRTPSEQVRSGSRSGATPRARYSTTRSQASRRSSVSSFASELDQRFNIRTDGTPYVPGMSDGNTDPRMIQAITQTMIGEYLWKYTRKAGRGEMSANRHRRFFWVHPYTRTLYWSDTDPSTAGRVQLKAKSVAIDAVQVVADDNPMPPGLHRKSLVIITPGRSIKITATTGQRHETWFNALSYLLVRAGEVSNSADPSALTTEDVAEFNPGYNNSTIPRTGASRVSLSSYNSRSNTRASSRGVSPNRGSSAMAMNTHPSLQQTQMSRHSQANTSISSRFSSYWRPHRGSVSSQTNGNDQEIYNASAVPRVHDSAEDVRQVLVKQEQDADRLENVRACCDGKHDVGSLSHRHTAARGSRTSRHSHTHGN